MSIDKSDDVRNHFVYRYYDRDAHLLYIGCTIHPEARFKEHRSMRPGMCAATVYVKISGPYSYNKAREIEREQIRAEDTMCGWSPAKQREKSARDRWIDSRIEVTVAETGMRYAEAIKVAVAEAAEWFPDPMESPYDPRRERLLALVSGGVS
ncbi:G-I-Y Y-I-G endonuclease [Gordonia phage OneDirection]|nr:G-I-Y Y-I-G endonuclease [Gordonia phage OneDirection]